MSFDGAGTFNINTAGQPPVSITAITVAAHTALTADLATGLSTCITKDGQTTTTAVIPFAAGISVDSITNSTGLSATTYTPTVTATTNVAATANPAGIYIRVGNFVMVSWTADIDPTAAAPTATEFQLSLPIASNLATAFDLIGTGNCLNVRDQTSTVVPDVSTNRASITFTATNAANATHRGFFLYQVI